MRWRCTSPITTRGRSRGRTSRQRAMPDLALEIEADQSVLEAIMHELGVSKPQPKRLAAWMASRAIKHKEPHELVELEMLTLGIAGKLLLWKALKSAEETEPYLRSSRPRPLDRARRRGSSTKWSANGCARRHSSSAHRSPCSTDDPSHRELHGAVTLASLGLPRIGEPARLVELRCRFVAVDHHQRDAVRRRCWSPTRPPPRRGHARLLHVERDC